MTRSLQLALIGSLAVLGAASAAHAQSTTLDGVYRGEASSGNGCSLFRAVLRVKQGEASMRYNPQVTFTGSVTADGSVSAMFGQGTLTGKIVDGKFTGGVSMGHCQYPLSLSK